MIETNNNKEEYPILLTAGKDSKLVTVSGSIINKESNSKEFKIIKDDKEYKFRLMNIRNQMFLLMGISFLVTVGVTVYMTVMAAIGSNAKIF